MPCSLRCLCLLLLPLISFAQEPPAFKLKKVIGTPLQNPREVAVGAHGLIYVLDNGRVTKLDPQGNFLGQLELTSPDPDRAKRTNIVALSADAAGDLYVVDKGVREVRKFSPEGQLLLVFANERWLTATDNDTDPEGVTVDAAGNVYVIEALRMLKFDSQARLQWLNNSLGVKTGNQQSTWASKDIAIDPAGNVCRLDYNYSVLTYRASDGQLITSVSVKDWVYNHDSHPSLAIDKAGNFYTLNGVAIYQYSSTGSFQKAIMPGFESPVNTLTFDADGNLFAATVANDNQHAYTGGAQLFKLNPAGQLLGKWGNLTELSFLTLDRLGNFCVYDRRIRQKQIIKYNASGQELLRFPKPGSPEQLQDGEEIYNVALDFEGNIYVVQGDSRVVSLKKFTSQGQYVKTVKLTDNDPKANGAQKLSSYSCLAFDPAGNIYFTGGYEGVVYKHDPNGQLLLQFGTPGVGPGQLGFPRAIAVDDRANIYVADINGHRLQKFSPTGQLLRENKALTALDNTYLNCRAGLSIDASGTVFLGSSLDSFTRIYSPDGKSSRQLPGTFTYPAINSRGTQLLALNWHEDAIYFFTAASADGQREGQISGRIFQDSDQSCNAQTSLPLPGTVVVAEPGSYYGYADENGNYTIAADTGRYTVRQLLPNEPGRTIEPTCATQPAVHLAAYDTTVPGPDFGNQVSLAPYLRVEVGSNRRRRCFRNLTSVRYANTGFAAARAAQVTVKLPEQVVLISASAPYTRDARGNYLFSVGDLAPQQSGQITITDSVACGDPAIRGLTVCTQAWITPGNSYPPPAAWNGGSVAVRGQATAGGQVRFALVNKGAQATGDSLGLRIFKDAKLALSQKYALAAGDSLILRVPAATGQALRLEADQPASHPLGALAAATVEAAGPRPNGLPNPAVLMLRPAPTPPTVAEDCQPIVDSFDPNDKQVLPTGAGPEHDTPPGTALRYQLRFQNTGTDVAYRVEVVDTLSADLDLRTLRVGAASHPYRLTVAGKTRPVLTFTFAGIMLPERSRSEAASNGFVQFSIRPKADLAPKTSIENYADIFFDYNEPVRTNTTTNRIYDAPAVVDLAVAVRLADVVVSPQLTSFAPTRGPAGTVVTLRGEHFAATASANQVSFNGVAATVLSAAPGQLTVQVPAGAASGRIRVVTMEGGAQSSADFQVGQATATAPAALSQALVLYPNPAPGGAATLDWRAADFTVRQVQVFDGRGARLLGLRPGAAATSLSLPLAGKAPGLYLVLVETSRGLMRQHLTVQ